MSVCGDDVEGRDSVRAMTGAACQGPLPYG